MLNYGIFTNFVFCGFLLKKRKIQHEKKTKEWQRQNSLSWHNFLMSRHNLKGTSKAMLQPAALCHNKVQAELKEEIELCRDKEFFYRDTAKEVCEEDCRDTLDSFCNIDQGKWQWNFVATILTLSQHKRMKIANELCHDRVWQGYNTS